MIFPEIVPDSMLSICAVPLTLDFKVKNPLVVSVPLCMLSLLKIFWFPEFIVTPLELLIVKISQSVSPEIVDKFKVPSKVMESPVE